MARIKNLVVCDDTASISSRMLDVFNLAFSCNVKVPKEIAALFRAKNLANSGQQALNGQLVSNAIPGLLAILRHKLRQQAESPTGATLTQQQLRQQLGAAEPVTGERVLAAIPEVLELAAIPEVLEVVQQHLRQHFVPTYGAPQEP